MSTRPDVSRKTTLHIRDACLCLHAQRAARALARRFDAAFQPLGLTNGQFSLMMALNRPDPPNMGSVAAFLAMDRTTLTAMLKSLARRGLVETTAAPGDRRSRLMKLTPAGRALLAQAVPVWMATHAGIEKALDEGAAARLREGLNLLAGTLTPLDAGGGRADGSRSQETVGR